MQFTTTIQLEGRTATGFPVPPEVVEALGQGKKRPAVSVTINGYTYRSTIAAYGDVFMLPLAAEHRTAAGVEAGDQVEVDVALDTAPREVEVPPDLAAALDDEPTARAFFDGLSYSHRRWFVLNVEGTKNEETRKRRVAKAVEMLREGRKPCFRASTVTGCSPTGGPTGWSGAFRSWSMTGAWPGFVPPTTKARSVMAERPRLSTRPARRSCPGWSMPTAT